MSRTANKMIQDIGNYKKNKAKDYFINMMEIDTMDPDWKKAIEEINWDGDSEDSCPAFAMYFNFWFRKSGWKATDIIKYELEKIDPDFKVAHRTFYSIKKGEAVPKLGTARALLQLTAEGVAKQRPNYKMMMLSDDFLNKVIENSKEYSQSLSAVKNSTRITLCIDFAEEDKKIEEEKLIANEEMMSFFNECDQSLVKMIDETILKDTDKYKCNFNKKTGKYDPNRNQFFKEAILQYFGFEKTGK